MDLRPIGTYEHEEQVELAEGGVQAQQELKLDDVMKHLSLISLYVSCLSLHNKSPPPDLAS